MCARPRRYCNHGPADRSYGVALLAGAGHLCVRGWWWSAGSMELVEGGLVTNVAASCATSTSRPINTCEG